METIINNIRKRIIDVSYKNDLGHVGSCLSCLEICAVLHFKIMKKKDLFIMSKGHAGLALYSTLVEKKILKKIDFKEIDTHPTKNLSIGIPFTAGSLGQGLPFGCGVALGNPKINIYCLLSDGECDEGSIWEAAKFAKDFNLKNLIAIVDANRWKAYDRATTPAKLGKIWKAFGWEVNFLFQKKELDFKPDMNSPAVYIVKTIKGKGLANADTIGSHYDKLTKKEYEENICKRTGNLYEKR